MDLEDDAVYDLRNLIGLGFRFKDRKIASALIKLRGNMNIVEFLDKYNLKISKNAFSDWTNLRYGIPLETVLDLLGWETVKKINADLLFSGRASAYACARLPCKSSVELMYLIGTIIGDGSLRHEKGKTYFESYFVSFEMKDKEIITYIQSAFSRIFGFKKPIRNIKRKDGRRIYLLKYSNKVVYYFLNRFFDLGPRKAKSVGITKHNGMTRTQKLALLLGLYHTDGSFSQGKLRFYTSSPRLKDDVSTLLKEIGYGSKEYRYQRGMYDPEYHVEVKRPDRLICELQELEEIL